MKKIEVLGWHHPLRESGVVFLFSTRCDMSVAEAKVILTSLKHGCRRTVYVLDDNLDSFRGHGRSLGLVFPEDEP